MRRPPGSQAKSRVLADGVYVTGPALELELPIFDQGQADVAIAESDLRAGSQRVSSLAIRIRSATRDAEAKLTASRDTVDYYERVLLPAHQAIVDEAQLHYNAMLIGVYDLLLDKRQQIETARRYVEALHDYWISRTELAMALGGALPGEHRASERSADTHESVMPENTTQNYAEKIMPAEEHHDH